MDTLPNELLPIDRQDAPRRVPIRQSLLVDVPMPRHLNRLHAGFCQLCWKSTEAEAAEERIEKCVSKRKFAKNYITHERPAASEKTLFAADSRLQQIIAASKSTDDPHLFVRLLYLYAHGFDYKTLREHGIESDEAQQMLLHIIEQNLIDEEWILQVRKSKADCKVTRHLKPRMGEDMLAPTGQSLSFCRDHNPRRSSESRRRYQNDRRLVADFEAEIDRLYSEYLNQGRGPVGGIHTKLDFQELRRQAHSNIFSSTLDKIKMLQKEKKSQTEIATILKITRQAVSNALRREKAKTI